jgi:hypothetical protein
MDDSKLLELASLASGDVYSKEHNPLERDDLALRLAVRLHIDIEIYNACVEAVWIDEAPSEPHTVVEYCDEEFEGVAAKEAATRRAIVRAAAEIGKGVVAQLSGKDRPEDDYYKTQSEAFYGDKP